MVFNEILCKMFGHNWDEIHDEFNSVKFKCKRCNKNPDEWLQNIINDVIIHSHSEECHE